MLGIIYDNITIYYYYEGSAGARHTDTREKEAPPVTRRQGVRVRVDFSVSLHARAHASMCVCVSMCGEGAHT